MTLALPIGSAASSPGSMVKLSVIDISAPVASVDFTSLFSATYQTYLLIGHGIVTDATSVTGLVARFRRQGSGFDSGSNYDKTGYHINSVPAQTLFSTTTSGWNLAFNYENPIVANFVLWFFRPLSAAPFLSGHWVSDLPGSAAGVMRHLAASGEYDTGSTAVDGVQVVAAGDNLEAGRFSLFGVEDV